jgi:hypothetical protein
MNRSGQSAILLVSVLLLTAPALAVSSEETDRQSGRPGFNFDPDLPLSNSIEIVCPPDQSLRSTNVVHASELSAQYSELRLSPVEIRDLVQNAKTPADHQRLAGYYSLRADSDLAQAREHQKIALKYSANSVGSSSKFISGTVYHGIAISRRLKQHAAKMRKLQQEQEQLARQRGE